MDFAERFSKDGWMAVKGLFDPAFIDRLRAEYLGQFDALVDGAGGKQYLTVGNRRLMLPVRLKGPFLDPALYANPLLLATLGRLLGKDFLIDSLSVVTALPGAADQQLHRDHGRLFPEVDAGRGQAAPFAITVSIPLIDLDEHTGSTKMLTGTHRAESGEAEETPYVGRGDCYLMDYELQHFGAANRSPEQRPIIYIIYTRPWFTDMVNFGRQQRIAIDRSDLAAIPEAHRGLFRRLAGKGSFDLSWRDLFPPPHGDGN